MKRKFSLTKGKGLFVTDLLLTFSFLTVVYSGITLHLTAHQRFAFGWSANAWTYSHWLSCGVFLFLTFLHVKSHLYWFKNVLKGTAKHKPMLIGFTLLLMSVVSGLLSITPANHIGLWHYRVSLIMLPFLMIHIVRRMPLVINFFKNKKTVRV